jgi:uncharacterized membrane protein YphA (DoxX/SURF4 family)
VPVPEGKDPRDVPLLNRMPPALNQDWEAYYQRFTAHYQLSDPQLKEARARFDQARTNLVAWLTDTDVALPVLGASTVGCLGAPLGQGPVLTAAALIPGRIEEHGKVLTKTFNTSSFETTQTMPVRIAEYQAKLNELHEVYDTKLPLMSRDVEKANLSKRKSEVSQLRSALVADLDARTADMKKNVTAVLTAEQKKQDAVAEPEKGALLKWIDRATVWGLTAIGAGIFFGLFTRLSCLLAAGFLLLTYGAEPAFPWLPVSPRSEGNYLFINKNVIEMYALLVLATLPTGRWLGFDGLVHWIFSRRGAATQK